MMWPFKKGSRLRNPVADAICDALSNDPDRWTVDIHDDLTYKPLDIHLGNTKYQVSLGLEVKRAGVNLYFSRSDWSRISQSVKQWKDRRRLAAERALVQDSDTLRLQRIQDFRAALAREERAVIERRL